MDVATLKQKLAVEESLILLDVRDADEIVAEPFFTVPPKNYLNLPILPLLFSSREELEAKIFTPLGYPTTTSIITLCHSGGRSARACKALQEHGWTAENLDCGKEAWGNPVSVLGGGVRSDSA